MENQSCSSGAHWSYSTRSRVRWRPVTFRRIQRSDHLHVDVQWRWLVTGGKQRHLHVEFLEGLRRTSKDVFERTLVILSDQKRKDSGERTLTNQTFRRITQLRWCWLISEKADILQSEEQVRCPEDLWRAKKVEKHRYTTTVIQRQQSWYFASLSPSISSVSTEQYRMGVKNIAQQISDHPSSSTGKLVAKMNDESESKSRTHCCWRSWQIHVDQCSSPGKLGAATQRKIRNPPEDIKASKAGDDADFIRKDSPGHYFVTIQNISLAGFGWAGSCREHTVTSRWWKSKPKGWIPEHKDWPSIGSHKFRILGTQWNWSKHGFHAARWISNAGLWSADV